MKHKIALIVASLAVMMAMIGTANADLGIALAPSPQIIVNVGSDGTQYVTVTTPSGTGALEINGVEINGDGTPYTVTDKFTVTVDTIPYTGPVSGDGTTVQTFAVKYTNDKGIPDGDYKVEYSATYLDSFGIIVTTNGLAEIVSIEASVLAIPEFPTVALPVAAVIGLVFFFQHRKRKEE